jgi:nucleotide-binding universal stress UspA family protein
MNSMNQAAVVVGVSGSAASAAALRWAADEARRRNTGLQVVCSWQPEFAAPYAPADTRAGPGEQRVIASEGLTAALQAAFGTVTPDGVTAELAKGEAEHVLVDRSAGAGLLVLGAGSSPAPAGQFIGPVIRTCLSRAHCPVVVVPAVVVSAVVVSADEQHARRAALAARGGLDTLVVAEREGVEIARPVRAALEATQGTAR